MKKIINAQQTHDLDQYTINQLKISSLQLMERASLYFCMKFQKLYDTSHEVVVYCGIGNNGGDGLVVARMLQESNYQVTVVQAMIGEHLSEDNAANKARLPKEIPYLAVRKGDELPKFTENTVAIDALFGSGLSRPIEGYWATIVEHINDTHEAIVAIDLPSGLYADQAAVGAIIRATHTFTFQLPKLSFFFC